MLDYEVAASIIIQKQHIYLPLASLGRSYLEIASFKKSPIKS